LLAFFIVELSIAQPTESKLTIQKRDWSKTELYDSIYQQIEITDDPEYFKSLHDMVYFDEEIADSTKLKFIFRAIERTKELGLEYHYARFIFFKSILSTQAGDYSKAIELANESMQIFLNLNEFLEVSSCYNTIGGMMAHKGDLEAGKTYLLKALEYIDLEKNDFSYDRVRIDHLTVYGTTFYWDNDMDSAFLLTKQALDLAIEKNFTRQEASCLNNLGSIFEKKKNYPLAKGYFEKALCVAQQTQMQTLKANVYKHLSDISVASNQFDSAFYFLDKGLDICNQHHSFIPIQLTLLSKKSKLLAERGAADLAYSLQLEHIALKDSFFTLEKEKEIQWVEAEFHLQNKDRDIKALSQQAAIQTLEIKQKNQALIIVLFVVLFMVSVAYFVYRQRSLKKQQAQTELEQRFLRSQMNPHFIFNALNSIQEYIVLNEKKQATKYLGMFADLMRVYLRQGKTKTISLGEEIEALNIYLELEKMRFEDSLTYTITVEENINTELFAIPSLLIQPYVENALKHGLLHKEQGRKLSIKFGYYAESKHLVCEIEDNGIGRKKSMKINKLRNPNHKSFASSATKKRLELLNYGSKKIIGEETQDLLDSNGLAKGTKVILNIPMELGN
jgi:tetratricopeptide (TPR) repeat protein